jgi:RNA polymerase sigma-B factor
VTDANASTDRENANTGYEHLAPLFEQMAPLDEDDPAREELRSKLVTGHLPLAEHIAARFSNRGVPREDLVQVATLGLINAVDRFQPDRGTDFLSFAVPTVMGEVRRHFRDASWSMHVPRRLKELNLAINSASAELSQHLGRAPTPSELAKRLDLSIEQVYEGLEAGNAYHSMSLDEALSPEADSDSLGETLGETDAALDGVEDYESLRPLIERLPERERTILTLRFFRNMTQTQIAERVGISQMHVSRLLARTLEQLREGMLMDDQDES